MSESYPPVALPDHPYAPLLQAYCLEFDGAFEDYPWGDIVYKVGKKIFSTLHGEAAGVSCTLKAQPVDADFLIDLPHIERAPYIGRYGWVTVHVTDDATLEHARDLIAISYGLVVGKKKRA